MPGISGGREVVPELPSVLDAIRILSPSRESGIHGESHWRRVAAHGLYLADEIGADRLIVLLFGMFHDSMRFSDGHDPDHGTRGGFLASCLNDELIGLSEERLDLLDSACRDHTLGLTSSEATIGACWDADRLDLVRLGTMIDNAAMSTEPGRSIELQDRARGLVTATPDWPEIFRLL
jgi:uncharacterized protein